MNNINELFTFFFGSQGEKIKVSRGALSRKDLKEIILNYPLGEIHSIQENQASIFTLKINEDILDFRYEFFSEYPELRTFAEVSTNFKLELNALIEELSLELTPKESEITAFLSDLLYNSVMIDFTEGGGDKFVKHLEHIKNTSPETYLIFKTFMSYRPQIWSAITSSAGNKNTPADKMKKITFALTDLMTTGCGYFKDLKNNSSLKVKDYFVVTEKLKEINYSISEFLCYLLKNPRQFPLSLSSI